MKRQAKGLISTCRWCATELQIKAPNCPNCHRGQSWFSGKFGGIASTIAVISAVITLGQLVIAVQHKNSADVAAVKAQNAETAAKQLLARVVKVEGSLLETARRAESAAHNAEASRIQTQKLSASIAALDILKRGKINELEEKRQVVKKEYDLITKRIESVSPKIETTKTEKYSIRSCAQRFLGACIKWTRVPKERIVSEVKPNLEYEKLSAKLSSSSESLTKIEGELGRLLK